MKIPVIDLSDTETDPGAKGRAAEAIDAACRTVGFFTIVNHGIPAEVDRACWEEARRFFDQPVEEKRLVAPKAHGDPYGYLAFAGETLAASLGETAPPDLKETFAIGPLARPEGLEAGEDADFVYAPSHWPDLPGFRGALEAYYRAMDALAFRLMRLFALGLGLEEGHFDRLVDRSASALRILNYPDLEAPPLAGQLRAGVHSDYGSLTILRQEDAPGGLEARSRDGTWHPVPEVPGGYVVNLGDLMAYWTNDVWVSTPHRVAVPPPDAQGSTRRQSIAFFHHPNWDAEIACLPSCREARGGDVHPAVGSGAYLMNKFRSALVAPGPAG